MLLFIHSGRFRRLAREIALVGMEGEHEREGVYDEKEDADLQGERSFPRRPGRSRQVMEERGDEERDRGQRQLGRSRPAAGRIELLGLELEPAAQHRGAQDEEGVADDRSGQRRLHDLGQPFPQCHDRDDELGHVAERGVEEPPDPFAGSRGEVLGGLAHPAGQRNDADSGEEEEPDVRLGRYQPDHDRDRGQRQEPVERGLEGVGHGAVSKHPSRMETRRTTRSGAPRHPFR